MAEATITKGVLSKEEAEKIKYKFKDFAISSYEFFSDIPKDTHDEEIKYTVAPEIKFYLKGDQAAHVKVTIEIFLRPTPDERHVCCRIVTQSQYGLINLPVESNEESTAFHVPAEIIYDLFELSFGSSRGALSLLSGSKFALPVIRPSEKFDLSNLKIINIERGG